MSRVTTVESLMCASSSLCCLLGRCILLALRLSVVVEDFGVFGVQWAGIYGGCDNRCLGELWV